MVAVSYRGYWTSHGAPSQKGIKMDAAAALNWVRRRYHQDGNLGIILWGQSIGAGVAAATGASYQNKEFIRSLILETPFTSIRDMLVALYPQRWLPYRYLWPFLWNRWDNINALQTLSRGIPDRQPPLQILVLQAGKDELVPASHSLTLVDICRDCGLHVHHCEIDGALHTEVMVKNAGRQAVVEHITMVSRYQTHEISTSA
jgi:fermentation-respiration switch protein FrsA (DUF1100 family)